MPSLNCDRQSIENRLIASRGSLAGRGTFVVGAPFSMRLHSLVKGYVPVPLTPLPSFFCNPEKYPSATAINSCRDIRCAGGVDLNHISSGLYGLSMSAILLGPP